jgi:hypothetical protein
MKSLRIEVSGRPLRADMFTAGEKLFGCRFLFFLQFRSYFSERAEGAGAFWAMAFLCGASLPIIWSLQLSLPQMTAPGE